MDHDVSFDTDLEDAIVEDLLPKPRRARQVLKKICFSFTYYEQFKIYYSGLYEK